MKKILLLLLPATMLLACNNEPSTTETSKSDSTSTTTSENVSLPYTVERTPDWERGDNANVAVAMNTLKAFEVNDMNAIQQYLADTVEFYADNFIFKGSKDTLSKLMGEWRSGMDSLSINMQDYESVKSKGRGEEWVGLWYTEVNTIKGKTDSMMVMDDIRIVNGKVVVIDSKMRRISKSM